ncbi:MAG TPA: patatin-like phospholipase family protein [Nitriliruptoraceae bacterium]|nr:patatin-like phospholipase family protein [Nitriliruptoraceae bacterium]
MVDADVDALPVGWHDTVAAALRQVLGQDAAVDALAQQATRRSLRPGDVLFEQHDPSDAAYLVLNGRLHAVDELGGTVVRELDRGALVGELGLLRDGPRSLGVVAARHTELAVVERQDWDRLSNDEPAVALRATRILLDRLLSPERNTRGLACRSVYVHDLHDPAGSTRLARRLLAASETRAGLVVTARDAVEACGVTRDDLGQGLEHTTRGLSTWLEELEDAHDVVLLADDEGAVDGWTQRTLGHADEVVLAVDASADPTVSAAEQARLDQLPRRRGRPRTTLLLRHPATTTLPSGTAAWLDRRTVDVHLHLRDDDPASAGRVARTVFGRPVAAVLGGGGAKGFAHIGVLRAMAAQAVPVDAVIGSSMGAAMSVAAAHAWPVDELEQRCRSIFDGLLDYTLPAVSLLRGRSITRAIEDNVPGDIEDAWVPTLVMSTDLTASDEVVHARGSFSDAVRASVAIPGVLPPVHRDGHVLVDAGCTNNLPVTPMRRMRPRGRVVAVDVATGRGPRAHDAFAPVQSGWGRLGRSLVPGLRNERVPSALKVLVASTVTASSRDSRRHAAAGDVDLYLDLDLPDIGLLDFDDVANIAARGDEVVGDDVARWWATQPESATGARPPSSHVGQRA